MGTRLQRATTVCSAVALCFPAAILLSACGGDSEATPQTGAAPGASDALRQAYAEHVQVLDPRKNGIGRLVPDLAYTDIESKEGHLSDFAQAKGLAIIIRDVGCPVSKKIGHATARVEAEYAAKGIAFLYVNLSGVDEAEAMRGEIETFGFDGTYAVDPEALIGTVLGAKTTTDVFVLDPSRTLVYRGAVDDQVGRGSVREKAVHEYLKDALDAVIACMPVITPATTAPGCLLALDAPSITEADAVTYHGRVSRILRDNCIECHRDGGAGPFSLETYKAARAKRGMLRFVVDNGVMPPWFLEGEHGPWANDRRLSAAEKKDLLGWIAAGCPEGDAAQAPTPYEWSDDWSIGEPDVVFEIPRPVDIPAEGVVDYIGYLAKEVVPRDMWVQKIEVLPTEAQVVHHAMVMVRPPQGDGGYAQSLFGNMASWARVDSGWQFFAGYLPGKNAHVYAEGSARFVPAGSEVIFFMHYTPNGVRVRDQTRVGLVEAKREPDLVAHSEIIRQHKLFLKPGQGSTRFSAEFTIPRGVRLRSLTPHMHLRGRTFHIDLVQPDGEVEELLRLPEWDQDWQFNYVFQNAPFVPAGSRIHVDAWYDNSSANPNNPDPSRAVKNGPQIWDEMLMLAIEWIEPRAGYPPCGPRAGPVA